MRLLSLCNRRRSLDGGIYSWSMDREPVRWEMRSDMASRDCVLLLQHYAYSSSDKVPRKDQKPMNKFNTYSAL